MDKMAGTSPPALPDVRATQPEQLNVYSGNYENAWARIELTPANGRLCMEICDIGSGLIITLKPHLVKKFSDSPLP
jgi:hypothetical protein